MFLCHVDVLSMGKQPPFLAVLSISSQGGDSRAWKVAVSEMMDKKTLEKRPACDKIQ